MAPKKTKSSVQTNSLRTSLASTKSSAGAVGSKEGSKKRNVATTTGSAESDGDLHLDGYPELFKEAQKKMGRPTHDGEGLNSILTILKVFDCSEEYGPASKIPRLERYERAERLGLKPPKQIGEILRTRTARTKPEYRDPVFMI